MWNEGIGCLEEQSGASYTRAWMHLFVLFLHTETLGGSLGVFFPQNKDFKQALMPVMLDPIWPQAELVT